MQIKHNFFHLKLLLSLNSTRVAKKVCLARNNNHPTSLASSWDISFLRSLVQQDPKGSDKVAHLFILDVYVSPNRKYVNLSIIYYILDFSFFMSQDDAYFHIHQNDPYHIWIFPECRQGISPTRGNATNIKSKLTGRSNLDKEPLLTIFPVERVVKQSAPKVRRHSCQVYFE